MSASVCLADVHTAPTLTKAGIETALAAASDGDVVELPAGDLTWTGATGTVTTSKSVFFIGQGKGNTASDTIIRHETGSSNQTVFEFSGTTGNHGVSGIRFDGSADASSRNDGLLLFQASPGLGMVWNCYFDSIKTDVILTRCYGVAWDNTGVSCRMLMCRNGDMEGVSSTYGDGAWESAINMGSADAWYVEDNNWNRTGASNGFMTDGWQGGRHVSRFNTLTNCGAAGNHGTESAQRLRSHRLMEVYGNTVTLTATRDAGAFHRGGTAISFDNTYTSTGSMNHMLSQQNYRSYTVYSPWGIFDGVSLWDVPRTTDTGTGDDTTGAGDGIYAVGTVTSGASGSVTDSGASWAGNYKNYTVRTYFNFTASSATSTTVTVSGESWTNNQFAEWAIYVNGQRGQISSNTDDTLTFDSNYFTPTVSMGDSIQLSYAALINSNTSTTLTTLTPVTGGAFDDWVVGASLEIRRSNGVLDGVGMGSTTTLANEARPDQVDLSQTPGGDPSYHWNCRFNGSRTGTSNDPVSWPPGAYPDRDWFEEEATFDGSAGVGIGVKADIEAGGTHETASTTGVGYWVTDEADWNANEEGNDGQLYKWNGSAWVLHYTPYTYPHPARASAPALEVAGAAYSGRLRFDGTGAKPVRTDGVGQPIIFDQ